MNASSRTRAPADPPSLPARGLQRLAPWMASLAQQTVERALALDDLWRVRIAAGGSSSPAEFARRALAQLEAKFILEPGAELRVPATGAAIVVANHPFGGLEGLYLVSLLAERRADVRFLANPVLQRIPELGSLMIPVDPFGGSRAATFNVAGLRKALRHVAAGGLLVIFPAGEVSHLQLATGQVIDPPWQPTAARLIRLSRCDVLPVHFGGSNSALFQLAGVVHPRLRTALLPREMLNKRHRPVPVVIGSPIAAGRIAAQKDDTSLAGWLRFRTYSLPPAPARSTAPHALHGMPIAPPTPQILVAGEIAALPASQTLVASGDITVFHASATQIPWTLQEIGRLREMSFRAAGEGTGNPVDLDRYDGYYVQLVAWNTATREIVGGYRIGRVDEIAAEMGCRGLYSHSLFAFGRRFLNQLEPALELGRSFVRPEYQKNFASLLLLWRGISAYVARHPRYRFLFGPVSISNDYHATSRELMLQFFRRRCFDSGLARLIRPRRLPDRRNALTALSGDMASLESLEEVTALVGEMEPDGKGVPVLLRQYLKIGGRFLGFNVDPRFSNVIDGLIVVDLPSLDAKTLQRYMGREEAAAYLSHHANPHPGARRAV